MKLLNRLILFCFGWRRRREYSDGMWRVWYRDPKTGKWWVEEVAIVICEKRVKCNN